MSHRPFACHRALTHALRRLLPLVLTLVASVAAAHPAVAPYVGTHRVVQGGQDALHLRIERDGAVEMVVPASGERVAGRALFGALFGRAGFTGLLASGETFAIGPHDGRTVLTVGGQMLALASLPPQQFGVAPAREPAAAVPRPASAAAGPAAGSSAASALAGLRLAMAKGGNGYFIERSFDFCADGRVFSRVAESQLSQFGSGVTESTDRGTWRLAGSTLHLALERGGARAIAVQRTEPTVFRLDGVGFLAERGRC